METKSSKIEHIVWTAPEYQHYDKPREWYIWGTVLLGIVVLYTLWVGDYLMLLTILIIAGVAYAVSHRPPREVNVTIDSKNITVNETVYPLKSVKYFWIHYQPPEVKTLNLETTNYINRDITIQLEDQDPNEVREFLLRFLPEDTDREETYTEKLSRKLRF